MATYIVENISDFLQNNMRNVLLEQIAIDLSTEDETKVSKYDNLRMRLQQDSDNISIQTSYCVVLHVPYLQSSNRVPGERDPFHKHIGYVTKSILSGLPYAGTLPLPDGVLSCGPSLIACTAFGTRLDPSEVLLQLFLQGHGAAEFDPSVQDTFKSRATIPINDIRELHQFRADTALVQDEPDEYPEGSGESDGADDESDDESDDEEDDEEEDEVDVLQSSRGPKPYGFSEIVRSPAPIFNSPASFMTASSPATFISARSTYNSPVFISASRYSSAKLIETIREDEPPTPGLSGPLVQLHNEYYRSLHQQEIIQPFDKELNWSGKGQHVTFPMNDTIPLLPISHLGSSMTATVDKVLCRRIALARKTMRCNRSWTVADALREVSHLQNVRHFHIVQLVGTYLQGRNFSILMYPAADMHLGKFLEDTMDMEGSAAILRRIFLCSTFSCLSSAVAFIHRQTLKHMDIKPQNILVKEINSYVSSGWRIYLADFGLSRSFATQDHSQTGGPTSRTPRYCAPEVYHFETRGRSADIFSLGCVFLETLWVIQSHDLQKFADARRSDGVDESFHANLAVVSTYAHANLCMVRFCSGIREMVHLALNMLDQRPSERPTATEIHSGLQELSQTFFSPKSCCSLPPEPYQAIEQTDPCNPHVSPWDGF